MSNDLFSSSLQQQYARLRQQQAILVRIQQELDFVDDPKRQMKLEHDQDELKAKQAELEQEICQQGLREARQLALKQAYARATLILKHILADGFACSELAAELYTLQQLEQQQGQVRTLLLGVSRIQQQNFKDIRKDVTDALKQVDNSAYHAELLSQIRLMLDSDNAFNVDDFVFWWENLPERTAEINAAGNEKNRAAERIRTGSMVLFLGSGVGEGALQEAELTQQLAHEAQYDAFAGSLSSIAEYYRLKFNLGTDALLNSMNALFSADATSVALFRQLAEIPARLILISAAYDDRLEQAFLATGKPFVSLTSIIPQDRNDIGHVLVSFSDNNPDAGVYSKENVSSLKLDDYSVIYKIRGTCRVRAGAVLRRDTIALTESDYFRFARHAEKIIPDYLAGQLRGRALLFIGYRPRHWEERLLASAVLQKRGFIEDPCFRLAARGEDPLEKVFWQNNHVTPYDMDVQELEQYLQGGMAR